MRKTDISKQTAEEYNGFFKDKLESLIRKTFTSNKEVLLFVSYQPSELMLNHTEVAEHTKILFGKFRYVEVIEQTYKTSNRKKHGKYLNCYHSHVLIAESDYETIEDLLKDSDVNVIAKRVWGLEGIKEYLAKQAGLLYTRILPTKHLPDKTNEPINVTVSTTKKPFKILVQAFKRVVRKSIINIKQFIIKPFESAKKLIYFSDS